MRNKIFIDEGNAGKSQDLVYRSIFKEKQRNEQIKQKWEKRKGMGENKMKEKLETIPSEKKGEKQKGRYEKIHMWQHSLIRKKNEIKKVKKWKHKIIKALRDRGKSRRDKSTLSSEFSRRD